MGCNASSAWRVAGGSQAFLRRLPEVAEPGTRALARCSRSEAPGSTPLEQACQARCSAATSQLAPLGRVGMLPPPCLKAAKEAETNEDDVSTQDTDQLVSPASEPVSKVVQVRRVHWDPNLPEDDSRSRAENECSKSYHKRRITGALNMLWEGKAGQEDWQRTIKELRSLRVHDDDGHFEATEGPLAEELQLLAVSACTAARAKELRSLRVHDGQFEGVEGPLAEELHFLAVSACTVARAKDEWSRLFCCPAPRDNSGAYEGCY